MAWVKGGKGSKGGKATATAKGSGKATTPAKGSGKGGKALVKQTTWTKQPTKGAWKPAWQPAGKAAGKGKAGASSAPKALPKDFEVDGDARYQGTVEKYNKFRGFGFIKVATKKVVPNDKIYVYWKSIKSTDRFPFLTDGMEVEFGVAVRKSPGVAGKVCAAKQVTLPGGGEISLQDDLDAEKKEFVGGQELRYTGTLKFFDTRSGFGYIVLDEGFDFQGAEVPGEIRVERSEVNSGGLQAERMKDMQVEFGIWKTQKGAFKAYNMTLPGGAVIDHAAISNRKPLGPKTLKGELAVWMWKQGWGMIQPENPAQIPAQAKVKLQAQAREAKQKAKAAGKEFSEQNWIYFMSRDKAQGARLTKGGSVTFQLYMDDKGVGAMNVSPVG